jgi:hypothetical protein
VINARFDFTIENVPNKDTMRRIADALQDALRDQFNTDVAIVPAVIR